MNPLAVALLGIVPVGATLSAWAVYGESIEPSTIFGCVMAFGAVALFSLSGRTQRQ